MLLRDGQMGKWWQGAAPLALQTALAASQGFAIRRAWRSGRTEAR